MVSSAASVALPSLSVVIASWHGVESLQRCLASLPEAQGAEVIVVTNFDCPRDGRARYVRMPPGTTVPVLRSIGIAQATGAVIALAEDHCTFAAGWADAIRDAHRSPHGAVGGPVENASTGRALDWAMYFHDYGKFMLPLPAAPVASLSGNNVSFRKEVLREVEETYRDGFFEPFTHGEIRRRGHDLFLAPGAVVYHQKSYRIFATVTQSYHLARSYAAKRVAGLPWWRRLPLLLGSVALPVVLPARIAVNTLRKKRLAGPLLRSLPLILLLTSSWALGEFRGYAFGEGRSAAEWK